LGAHDRLVRVKRALGNQVRGLLRPFGIRLPARQGMKKFTFAANIRSADSGRAWAQEALAAKNRLVTTDAKLVEEAFEHRLSELAPSATAEAADDAPPRIHVDLVGAHGRA
jgi:hypothetical protein